MKRVGIFGASLRQAGQERRYAVLHSQRRETRDTRLKVLCRLCSLRGDAPEGSRHQAQVDQSTGLQATCRRGDMQTIACLIIESAGRQACSYSATTASCLVTTRSPEFAVLQNKGAAVVRPQVVHLLAITKHVCIGPQKLALPTPTPTPTAFALSTPAGSSALCQLPS